MRIAHSRCSSSKVKTIYSDLELLISDSKFEFYPVTLSLAVWLLGCGVAHRVRCGLGCGVAHRVRCGSDSSAPACCTAGPGSNLGSAPKRRP
jgi:hypothetical protein